MPPKALPKDRVTTHIGDGQDMQTLPQLSNHGTVRRDCKSQQNKKVKRHLENVRNQPNPKSSMLTAQTVILPSQAALRARSPVEAAEQHPTSHVKVSQTTRATSGKRPACGHAQRRVRVRQQWFLTPTGKTPRTASNQTYEPEKHAEFRDVLSRGTNLMTFGREHLSFHRTSTKEASTGSIMP